MKNNFVGKMYEQLDHTADIMIRVWGSTIEELFINSAIAMFDIIAERSDISHQLTMEIEIVSSDVEELLVDWLSDLNFLYLTESKVFNKFIIDQISANRLTARAIGEMFDGQKHSIKNEIKAVTFHDLKIEKINNFFETKIIFDI